MEDQIDLLLRQLQDGAPGADIASIAVSGRIARIAIHLGEIRDSVFAPHGISLGESDVLAALWRQGPPYELSPGRLRASVTISSGGMTGRLDRLERGGLVARRSDPSDRRGVLVRLTSKGQSQAAELIGKYLVAQRQFLSALTPEEQELLEGPLRKLMIAAEQARAAPPHSTPLPDHAESPLRR